MWRPDVLTPGLYVGAADIEGNGESFDEKMAQWERVIRENFESLGYGD